MDALRPLAYESLKAVLQYMEPNLRFKLSNRVPSIVSTEKVVPLKIDRLEFNPYEVIVNDTSYKLGTYRHFPPGVEAHLGHREANSKGGVPYDLDQYGFADYSSEDIITAGDVVIKDTMILREPLTEEEARRLESRLEVFELILAKSLGYNVEPLSINHPHYFLVQQYKPGYSGYEIEKIVGRLKADLDPVHCRRNNSNTQYSAMVQLTVQYPNFINQISRKQGGTKLYEVMKILATRLFGNRKDNVLVKQLNIGFCSKEAAQMVIRLPPDFRIKVRGMCVYRNARAVCDALRSLVHSSSYPLEQFRVSNSDFRSCAHPTVCNAKRLRFSDVSTFGGGMIEFLQFHNQWIYLCQNMFTANQHITLLRSWIENCREVGTCFVSKFIEKTTITEIFEKCKEELNGFDAGKRSVKVPISTSSEIYINYKFLKKREKWMLAIRVVAV